MERYPEDIDYVPRPLTKFPKDVEEELLKNVDKIRNLSKGFEFTIDYSAIETYSEYDMMNYIIDVAREEGLIETIDMEFEDAWNGKVCSKEKFIRI